LKVGQDKPLIWELEKNCQSLMFQEELNREQVKGDLVMKLLKITSPPELIRVFKALSLFLKTAKDVSLTESETKVRAKSFNLIYFSRQFGN
jgi:hypothetical protein